jgi:hypothetical protein
VSAVDGHSLNGRRDAETAALLDGVHTPLARMFLVCGERGGGGAFVDSSSLEEDRVHVQEVWGGG